MFFHLLHRFRFQPAIQILIEEILDLFTIHHQYLLSLL